MSFIWPSMLFLLLLIPLIVAWYIWIQRKRQQLVARYGSLGFMQGAVKRGIGARRHIAPFFFLISLIILTIALARPEAVIGLPRVEGTVILAFDVSGSMSAEDLKPTRMEAAKTAALSFVEQQPPYVQIGVVAFSESGIIVQPPTYERGEVIAVISRMTPQRGTSLANGIFAALNSLEADKEPPSLYTNLTPAPTLTPTAMPKGMYASGVIVLLTDGENTGPPDPLEAVQAAAYRGVRIFTVGIGSAAGATINIEGFTVHTRLDEPTLRLIAQFTNGEYYNAENEEELLEIYNNLNPQLIVKPEKLEVTSVFAGVGILILLLGGTISLLWFGRVP
jgi:Ca-activated chloride channel homolog